MPPSSHATPDVAQRTADAAAWLREFFPHDDGGRVRLAEHTADGWNEYPRGVSLHDGPEPLADMAEALAKALVDRSEHADLYACPYAHEGERHKGGAVARRHAHADVDGPLDLEPVRELGALAVASGSISQGVPHGHVYVRLTRPVTADEHSALCAALGAYLGPHADASKVADNDVLRPAGTLNHKGGRRAPVAWLIRPDAPTVRAWEPAELAEHLGLAWPLPAAPSAPAGRAGTGGAASASPSARPRTGAEIRAELEALADAVRRAERGAANTPLNAASYRLARLVCEAAPGEDVPTEAEVHEALVGAYMDRPVPHGETASARRRDAERTVRSGWTAGTTAPVLSVRRAPAHSPHTPAHTPTPAPAALAGDAPEAAATRDVGEPVETPDHFRRDVDAEKYRAAVRDTARLERAAERAGAVDVPRPQGLAEFIAAYADDEAAWLVDGLWPAGGRVLLVAAYKAGKTTTVANLVRSLVDGDRFLGRFEVNHDDGAPRVVVVDTEMTERQLARWLRDSQITRRDLVDVLPLRGKLSAFNVLEPALADVWASTLRGADVVILDNLRPVLDALGLDENREAGRFLTAWDELMEAAGVRESLVVHHAGHGQDRARGDSALMASNDSIWTLRRDGESASAPRFFRAMGRDVNVPEVRVEFSEPTRRLSLSTALPDPDAPALAALPAVVSFLMRKGMHSVRAIQDAREAESWEPSRDAVRDALKLGERRGLLYAHSGPKRSRLYGVTPAGREWIGGSQGSARGADSVCGGPLRTQGENAPCETASVRDASPHTESAESRGSRGGRK